MKNLISSANLSRQEIIRHIREGILTARGDVVGIVIFGSFARQQAWHDVDVLVVLRDQIPTRATAHAIVVQLRAAIGLVELDLIPIAVEQLPPALAAHSPLLMEIAFDGRVIHDQAGITQLLQTAREQITRAGIRRTPTGWRFPVIYRQPSPLSPESNEARARRWLTDAQRDLAIAEALKGSEYFDRSVYHSQQSIERSVKAVLICFGAFERVHWVGEKLLEELAQVPEWREPLTRLAEISIAIEPAAIDARYIDDQGEQVYIPWERYRAGEATQAIDDAHAALAIARDFVEWWFEPPKEQEHKDDET